MDRLYFNWETGELAVEEMGPFPSPGIAPSTCRDEERIADPDAVYIVEKNDLFEGWQYFHQGQLIDETIWEVAEREDKEEPSKGAGWKRSNGFHIYDVERPGEKMLATFATRDCALVGLLKGVLSRTSSDAALISLPTRERSVFGQMRFYLDLTLHGLVSRSDVEEFRRSGTGRIADLIDSRAAA